MVQSSFEPQDHFIQLNVSTSTRRFLHAKHKGDAGRRIHEEPCTCPASP